LVRSASQGSALRAGVPASTNKEVIRKERREGMAVVSCVQDIPSVRSTVSETLKIAPRLHICVNGHSLASLRRNLMRPVKIAFTFSR
jgi:hypothetical protein